MEKIIVPLFVFSGIVASFGRELVLAYYYGASSAVDVFRIATYVPLALFQSLGTVFVGLYLARISPGQHYGNIEESLAYIFRFSLLISLAGAFLAPLYSGLLAPGLSDELRTDMVSALVISWSGYLLASLYSQSRIILQLYENKYLVSATSMLISVFFLVMLFFGQLLDFKAGSSLSFYLVASFFMVSLLYIWQSSSLGLSIRKVFICGLRSGKHSAVSPFTFTLAIITFFLITVMSRVIDRVFVSEGVVGSIACLDYAYNLYTAFGLMLGTSAVIIYSGRISRLSHTKYGMKSFLLLAAPTLFISVVVALVAYGASEETIRIVYGRGVFNAIYLDLTHGFYQWLLLPLPLMILNMLLIQYLLSGSGMLMLSVGLLKVASKWIVMLCMSSDIVMAVGISNFIAELVFYIFAFFGVVLLGSKRRA